MEIERHYNSKDNTAKQRIYPFPTDSVTIWWAKRTDPTEVVILFFVGRIEEHDLNFSSHLRTHIQGKQCQGTVSVLLDCLDPYSIVPSRTAQRAASSQFVVCGAAGACAFMFLTLVGALSPLRDFFRAVLTMITRSVNSL